VKIRHALILAAVLAVLGGCNNGSWSSGDRVLVSKCLYETGIEKPRRFDVVVFKYPVEPLKKGVPTNYIKRLLGLPGQLLAIFFGQLFFFDPEEEGVPPPFNDLANPEVDQKDLWRSEYMHVDRSPMREWFMEGKFHIVRKPPDVMMALRRIVYDNDYQASDLGRAWKRWAPSPTSSWKASDDFRNFSHAGGKGENIDWLRYQNLIPPGDRPEPPKTAGPPQLITDFEAYNQFRLANGGHDTPRANWVGDLMLECQVQVEKAEGFFYMELSKGINRFRARFDLEKGQCTLLKQGPKEAKEGKWEEMASKETSVKKPGTYMLRFANFDARLTLWVDRQLPVGDGHDYPPPEVRDPNNKQEAKLTWKELRDRRGPRMNDLEPASLGSQGAQVQLHNLRLWRDTYYTLDPNGPDVQINDWADPNAWGEGNLPADKNPPEESPLRNLEFKTMYVQPGHYLCLGDNSPASSDSRSWGLVPQRLMLGRALLVYYPFDRAGPIR
jgi:signal peptidase I